MLSYDPSKLPTPATDTHAFLVAILVELRAIRIALQPKMPDPIPPVVMKKAK